jgi:predicted amidophosphoribosyltransferase
MAPKKPIGSLPLRGKNSKLCPYCDAHTEQIATDIKTRLCLSCSNPFRFDKLGTHKIEEGAK